MSLTTRDVKNANSGSHLRLGICQGSNCCTTNKLPGSYLAGETATWTESAVLNDCSGMKINVKENVQVTIDALDLTDGWVGQGISINTENGQSTDCPIHTCKGFKNDGRSLTSFRVTCTAPHECNTKFCGKHTKDAP